MPDFIGGDPESNASECPAVFVIPETGDFVFRGKTITDPALVAELSEHIGKAEDESDVWLPARMAPFIRDALDGYEQGREGPGQHTFAELLAATQASVIRFEMRDSSDPCRSTCGGSTPVRRIWCRLAHHRRCGLERRLARRRGPACSGRADGDSWLRERGTITNSQCRDLPAAGHDHGVQQSVWPDRHVWGEALDRT